jgi:O-antigen ligase
MSKVRERANLFIYFLATILIVGLTFFFLEQSIITDVTPGYYFDPLTLSNQMMVTGIIVTLVSIFSFFVIRKIRLSVNGIILCIVLTIVFTMALVNLLIMPKEQLLSIRFLDGTYHDINFVLPTRMRLTAIMTLVVNFSFIFFVVLVLPNHVSFLKLVLFFTIAIVLIAFFAIGYSLATEWEKYVAIVKEGPGSTYQVPASFFNNRNPYASFLLNAQVMLFFLYYKNLDKKRRFFYILLQIPLVLAINFTYSKTNLLLVNILLIIAFLFHLVRLLGRKKFIRFGIEVFLAFLLVTGFIVFRYSQKLETTNISLFLHRTLPDEMFERVPGSFDSRKKLWYYAVSLMVANPIIFVFGHGPHLSRYFYHLRMQIEIEGVMTPGFGDYHNGLVEVMHTFGASGLIIYALVFLFVTILLIRRARTNRSLTFFVLLSMGVFILRSQMESLAVLLLKSEGIMASLTFVLPALYLLRKSHECGFSKELKVKKTRPEEA